LGHNLASVRWWAHAVPRGSRWSEPEEDIAQRRIGNLQRRKRWVAYRTRGRYRRLCEGHASHYFSASRSGDRICDRANQCELLRWLRWQYDGHLLGWHTWLSMRSRWRGFQFVYFSGYFQRPRERFAHRYGQGQ